MQYFKKDVILKSHVLYLVNNNNNKNKNVPNF